MTEGPEATYLAMFIAKHFKGKRLRRVVVRGGRYKTHGPPAGLRAFTRDLPARLISVRKKGKVIVCDFEGGWSMVAKMGMVGWFGRSGEEPLFDSTPNVVFEFDGEDLYFYDFRNFGTLTFTRDGVTEELDALAPDVFTATATTVLARVEGFKGDRTLDELLMDQTALVSGVGNIIKAELLYAARLSPKRRVRDMRRADWIALLRAARMIARRVLLVLEDDGKDFDDYFAIHAIYQKDVDPLGNPVRSYKSADGRTTFWVPRVQE
jgi:formamidopyrimidine-DNA glycosylase